MTRLQHMCLVLACGVTTAAVSQSAWAGELKLFAEAPKTDDSGKLTGNPKSVTELPSVEGEETWEVHLWAKIDKGAPGPLYATFKGKLPDGKPYTAGEFEKAEYEGEKYVSWSIELDGNAGFNRNRTYQVELNQLSADGKPIKFAASSLKLLYTEAAPEPKEDNKDDDDDDDDDDDGGDDLSAQDVHDTLASGGGSDGPPPVAPGGKKKGCSVGAQTPLTGTALLLMLGLGALVRRRR